MADSMGLGKSLSVISLLAMDWSHRPKDLQGVRPTLLVVTLPLIRSWEEQFRSHLHPRTLRWWTYHGPNRSKDVTKMLGYDIVLTTYDVVAQEWRNLNNQPHPLFSTNWRRIVLDEGKIPSFPRNTQADSNGKLMKSAQAIHFGPKPYLP